MCGLVGYYGKINYTAMKAVKDLLRVDVVRGPHSTGVAFVREDEEDVHLVKDAILPDDLFLSKEWDDINKKNFNLIMGFNFYEFTVFNLVIAQGQSF